MGFGNEWMRWGLERAAGTMQRKEQEAQQQAQQDEAQQQGMLQRASDVVQALLTRNADRDARRAEQLWRADQARQERIAAFDRDAVRYTNDRTQEAARESRQDARLNKQMDREDAREKGRAAREEARDKRQAEEQALRDERQAKSARQLEAMRQAGRGAILDKRAAQRLAEIRAKAEHDPLGALASLERTRVEYFKNYRESEMPAEYLQTLSMVHEFARRKHGLNNLPGQKPPAQQGQQQEREPGDWPLE